MEITSAELPHRSHRREKTVVHRRAKSSHADRDQEPSLESMRIAVGA